QMAVADPAAAVNFPAIPRLHLAVLAVARREVFVPTLFAYEGQQPVALRAPYAALADAATPPDLWALVRSSHDRAEAEGGRQALQQYDFVAVVGGRLPDVPQTACFRSFFK